MATVSEGRKGDKGDKGDPSTVNNIVAVDGNIVLTANDIPYDEDTSVQGAINVLRQQTNTLNADVDAHKADAAPHSGHETPSGAQAKANAAEANAKGYTDTHAGTKNTHGVGSGYYIAKTSRSDQLPAWNDVQGKPSDFTPSAHKSTHASGGSDALTPSDIGAETPAGAQAKADAALNSAKAYTDQKVAEVSQELVTHKAAAAPHSGHETPSGAQAKANAAENAAKAYTDQKVGEVSQELVTHKAAAAPHSGHETLSGAQEKANAALAEAKLYAENVANSALNNASDYTNQVAAEINQRIDGLEAPISTPPVVGVKTVTATAAEIFAGASTKSNRRKLILKNEDPVLRFRIGPSTVTQQNGFPVEPGAVVEIQFDPSTYVPIYAISEGASLQVAVMEI